MVIYFSWRLFSEIDFCAKCHEWHFVIGYVLWSMVLYQEGKQIYLSYYASE